MTAPTGSAPDGAGRMAAGRELDERVARVVFGEPAEHVNWWWWSGSSTARFLPWSSDLIGAEAVLYAGPAFSSEIEAAWMVVEALRERGFVIVIATEQDGWEVEVGVTEAQAARGYRGCYTHGSAPLAICNAAVYALAALGAAGDGGEASP